MAGALRATRGNLTVAVIKELMKGIDAGTYPQGAKLPSEQELCRTFGVSRTVVREATASLRLSGHLLSKQGLGVFVTKHQSAKLDFNLQAPDTMRSAIQILELRIAIELEAVTLAAQRRTPDEIAALSAAYDRCAQVDAANVEEEAKSDLAFHISIAGATGNPHFSEILLALSKPITSDLVMKYERSARSGKRGYAAKINREHGAILSAIVQGDAKAARSSMRRHLEESLTRYRRVLDEAQGLAFGDGRGT